MPATCYILHSPTLNKFYIGVTQSELDSRIKKHNEHSYGNHRFTAQANDWETYNIWV